MSSASSAINHRKLSMQSAVDDATYGHPRFLSGYRVPEKVAEVAGRIRDDGVPVHATFFEGGRPLSALCVSELPSPALSLGWLPHRFDRSPTLLVTESARAHSYFLISR